MKARQLCLLRAGEKTEASTSRSRLHMSYRAHRCCRREGRWVSDYEALLLRNVKLYRVLIIESREVGDRRVIQQSPRELSRPTAVEGEAALSASRLAPEAE